MMKMVSLELPKSKPEKTNGPCNVDSPRYPYGFELRFNNEQLKKMPDLKDVKPGDKIMVQGVGHVVSTSSRKDQDGKDRDEVVVQLTKVGCECDTDAEFDAGFKKAEETEE